MKEIAISEFKANCLGILEEVRKTRKPIRVTRFGKQWPKLSHRLLESRQESGWGAWLEPGASLASSSASSSAPSAAKATGKPPANEPAARYAHLALERARAKASVKAHRTGHRQLREPAVAFAHQRLSC
jgi:hypothetical protein